MKINKSKQYPGIVTVNEYVAAPNGIRYLYFYCDRWQVVTDKLMSKFLRNDFRSTAHWSLAAINDKGKILALFPGCQINGWVYTDKLSEEYMRGVGVYYFK